MSRVRTKKKKRVFSSETLEKLRSNMAKAREIRAKKLSGAGHVTPGEPAKGKVHSPQETAAPESTVMSVANIEALWLEGDGASGLELQAPDYTEPEEPENIDRHGLGGITEGQPITHVPAHMLDVAIQFSCLVDRSRETHEVEKPLMQTPAESYSEVCCTAELTVTKLVQNPRIILASTPLLMGDQHVIVGNSENFVIGMKIPVIRNPPNPAYWLLNGPLPRSKGRW